jgi:hypothetical protein
MGGAVTGRAPPATSPWCEKALLNYMKKLPYL